MHSREPENSTGDSLTADALLQYPMPSERDKTIATVLIPGGKPKVNSEEKIAKKLNALLIVVSTAVVLAVLYVCGGFVYSFFVYATPRGTDANVLSVESFSVPTETPSSE